ncbi:HAMP domain-containing sensor histidine kinase [Planotetraspora kaengkrachanensis]|uniref:histidine kinase n=1 Tax=Planotetraspora kaengkrachanensis TaxID=575193 RepID=A0A8J3LTH9_9ACTN|nr:two-component sensor histidine kinase [Planotetraspora kaengkrachanensis]
MVSRAIASGATGGRRFRWTMYRPQSLRARYTMAATALSFLVLTGAGASLDMVIRHKLETDACAETRRVAGLWSTAMRNGEVPHTIPVFNQVKLVQVVDSDDRVVEASKQAAALPPLSAVRPPPDNPIQKLTECGPNGCSLLTAIRTSREPDSTFVYAALPAPSILMKHRLELWIAAAALPLLVAISRLTWTLLGRSLCPVTLSRARMSQITPNDLSLRLPQPPGRNEISQLVGTANEVLDRMETAVQHHRRFASDASHELRTPMAGMRLQLEGALLDPENVNAHDAIRSALVGVDRLQAIVDDLLVMARITEEEPAPPGPVDVTGLVREAVARRNGGVPVHVHPSGCAYVSGTIVQLTRVVENLLNNAQRHAETRVDVAVETVNGDVVVTVSDDGDGIAPRDRERVFERFTRLDSGRRRDPSGSGLGLAISREIAEAHGGTLRCEDSPLGARLVLRLRSLDQRSDPLTAA